MFSYKVDCTNTVVAVITAVARKDPNAYTEIDLKAQILARDGVSGELLVAIVDQKYFIYAVGMLSVGPSFLVRQDPQQSASLLIFELFSTLPHDATGRFKFLTSALQRDGLPSQPLQLVP